MSERIGHAASCVSGVTVVRKAMQAVKLSSSLNVNSQTVMEREPRPRLRDMCALPVCVSLCEPIYGSYENPRRDMAR